MTVNHRRTNSFSNKWIVVAVLSISVLLRWALVVQGGQYYFSDEHRYDTSRDVAGFLLQGKFDEAFSHLFITPEHLGFKVIGIVPALVEQLTRPSPLIPALFFSLFSVLNLYLIFLLAQRAGATRSESLLALGIAASSQALLYYSRHLMPYDTAMTFGLLSLYTALKEKGNIKTSLVCGALAFLCFLTYNGYWILAGFAMLCHLFAGEKRVLALMRRGALLATGFAIPLIVLWLGARWTGINLVGEYAKFARTVNQGDFSEGWSLPFEYFWHAEHFLIVILVVLALLATLNLFKGNSRHTTWWLAGLFFVYGCLVLFSVYFHSFVVLGRLARQMLPFLILLAAHGLAQITFQKSYARYLTTLTMVLIVTQGLWNYGISFMLSYPREFSMAAQAEYRDFSFSPKRLLFGAPALCENNGYLMENAKYFLRVPEFHSEIRMQVLSSQSHPVNFLPYQYEGYTPEQRQEFRERNLQMNLYKVNDLSLSETDPVLKDIKNCLVKE